MVETLAQVNHTVSYSTVKLLKLKNKQTLNCCSTHFTFYSFTVQTSSSFYIMIKDKKYKLILILILILILVVLLRR
jgi:hypothetical protein